MAPDSTSHIITCGVINWNSSLFHIRAVGSLHQPYLRRRWHQPSAMFEQAVEDQCKSNNQKACSSYEASNEIYYDSHKKRETEKEAYLN